eukprot:gene19405-26062_t
MMFLTHVMEPNSLLAADFIYVAWISLALLAVRVASQELLKAPLEKVLHWLRPGAEKQYKQVFDDLFIAVTSVGLAGFAVYVTLRANYECLPWNTDPCLVGWPAHDNNMAQRWFFITIAGYNVYEFICTAINYGTILNKEMIVHHIITILLVTLSYVSNLLRFGTMWIALFDLSNPILHGAKMLNTIDAPSLQNAKWLTFLLFAVMFFLGRIAAPPYSILRPAFTQSFSILPLTHSTTFVALMMMIFCLQCFWFYKIVIIASGGGKKKSKRAVEELKVE